jgi:hypothetical protein
LIGIKLAMLLKTDALSSNVNRSDTPKSVIIKLPDEGP